MTRLGWETASETPATPVQYLILGGHISPEFKNESSNWGILEIVRKQETWTATWTNCGQFNGAGRAWHSAIWLGGEDNSEGKEELVFICGGTRKKGNSVPAMIWNSKHMVFDQAST